MGRGELSWEKWGEEPCLLLNWSGYASGLRSKSEFRTKQVLPSSERRKQSQRFITVSVVSERHQHCGARLPRCSKKLSRGEVLGRGSKPPTRIRGLTSDVSSQSRVRGVSPRPPRVLMHLGFSVFLQSCCLQCLKWEKKCRPGRPKHSSSPCPSPSSSPPHYRTQTIELVGATIPLPFPFPTLLLLPLFFLPFLRCGPINYS